MFLHSGASLHGHEYSTARNPNSAHPPARRIFLRSALRPLSDAESNGAKSLPTYHSHALPPVTSGTVSSTPPPPSSPPPPPSKRRSSSPPTVGRAATLPSRPRLVSEHVPKRGVSVRFKEDVDVMDEEQDRKRDATAAVAAVTTVTGPAGPASAAAHDDSVSFSDGSDGSIPAAAAAAARPKSKRAPRKATRFILAQPAPRLATKQRRLVHIRPRLLLQLQRVTDTRPKPAFDALPSALVAGRVIPPVLMRKFPRLFRTKPELGVDDIILARSEDYDAPEDSGSDELDRRDLVGVVSPLPAAAAAAAAADDDGHVEGTVEIVLADGGVWTGRPMANGSYEFAGGVDEAGRAVAARWVRKPVAQRSSRARARSQSHSLCGSSLPPSGTTPAEDRYTFSVLDPSSRRHPILATLDSTTLDILDSYATVSDGRHPPARPAALSGSEEIPGAFPSVPPGPGRVRESIPVDEATRALITATAVWITVRNQGSWPSASTSSRHKRRASVGSVCGRETSLSAAAGTAGPTAAPVGAADPAALARFPADRVNTFPLADTRNGALAAGECRRDPPSSSSQPGGAGPSTGRRPAATAGMMGSLGFPKRAVSTGAAFMRRKWTVNVDAPAAASCPSSHGVAAAGFGSEGPARAAEGGGEARASFRSRISDWKDRVAIRMKGL